ncbi:MAG TPA: phosphatidate cytidylyltransferase [Myxococcales bacterium]|nr:phosphatidate cytidylyltransferase [Myxococcales bacterium]
MTSFIVGPTVIALIAVHELAAAALFAVASAIAAWEYARLSLGQAGPEAVPAWLGAGGLTALAAFGRLDLVVGGLGALLMVLWIWQVARADTQDGHRRASYLAQAVLFGGMGPFALAHLRSLPLGVAWALMVLVATFANDAGALFAGKAFGRHKLAPVVSPNKSWEGWVGGAVAGAALTVAMRFLPWEPFARMPWPAVAGIAAITAVIGPLGDLSKSLLKRAQHASDTGRLLPGHGGLLDRIDALSFNAAAASLLAAALAAVG